VGRPLLFEGDGMSRLDHNGRTVRLLPFAWKLGLVAMLASRAVATAQIKIAPAADVTPQQSLPPFTTPTKPPIPPTSPPPASQSAQPGAPLLVTRDEVKKLVDEAVAARESAAKQKKEKAQGEWVEVSNNPALEGVWDNSLFFVSPNKDWRVHL